MDDNKIFDSDAFKIVSELSLFVGLVIAVGGYLNAAEVAKLPTLACFTVSLIALIASFIDGADELVRKKTKASKCLGRILKIIILLLIAGILFLFLFLFLDYTRFKISEVIFKFSVVCFIIVVGLTFIVLIDSVVEAWNNFVSKQ